jgi:hypothetical protein
VTALSETWTVSARSNAGVVASNPTRDTDDCIHLYSLSCPVCKQKPSDGLIPVQGILPTAYMIM